MQKNKRIEETTLLKMLEKPIGKVDIVLDTDTFNEIDDQYALAYLMKSSDNLSVKAIYAAPFLNEKSVSPSDGMEKSYKEIMRVLSLMNKEKFKECVLKGSRQFLPSEDQAVQSPAAVDLAKRAMNYCSDNPLYVVAIGAITNIASAILINPEIIDKVVIVWLGGHALHWPNTKEFNLYQDVASARVVLGCGVPVVLLPCKGVVSEFRISGPELEHHLRGKNELCDYLVDVTTKEAEKHSGLATWTRVIWDVTAVAWLLEGEFMHDYLVASPIPTYDGHYVTDSTRHFVRYVYHIERDNLFEDLFHKLSDN